MILDGKKLRDELLVQYKEKIKEENIMSFYEDDEDDIDLPSLK